MLDPATVRGSFNCGPDEMNVHERQTMNEAVSTARARTDYQDRLLSVDVYLTSGAQLEGELAVLLRDTAESFDMVETNREKGPVRFKITYAPADRVPELGGDN